MLKLKNFTKTLFAAPLFLSSVQAAQTVKQPNVLLIITDDQGIGDFGFINPLVKTPNIDKLASESALYTNFVACPASSPSRSSLYTGRNHLLTGVWGVSNRANLLTDEVFMQQFLRSAGYKTFLLGKGDCTQSVDAKPWDYGWDNGYIIGGYQQKDPKVFSKQGAVQMKGYSSELMSADAIQFMKETTDRPWFISLNYITPHLPWVASPEFKNPYKAAGCSDTLSACWGAITQMDAALGGVMAQLKKQGIDDNTIVLLYSDNGATGPEAHELSKGNGKERPILSEDWQKRNALKLRAYKSSTYQNGVRVPLMVKYPKVIQPGLRKQFARVEDVLPTLLDLTNIRSDKLLHQAFSGVSFLPTLKDATKTMKVPDAFRINIWYAGSPHTEKGIISDPKALKYEEHHLSLQNEKYVYHHLPDGTQELYDLTTDPTESNNVADKFPVVLKQMSEECGRQWDLTIASGRAFLMPEEKTGRK